jgi:hypothetical protein
VFVLRRRPTADAPLPPSLFLIPIAAVSGLGAAALALLDPGLLARVLGQQGPLLFLIVALAPMLAPLIVGVAAAPIAARRGFHAAVGLARALSFPLEVWSPRGGLLLRGASCGAAVLAACPPSSSRPRPGLHRGLFRLALYLIPLGLLFAGILPERRVAMLHITFIGGLYAIVVAVSAHVTMLHTDREPMASRRPWPIALASGLAVAALVARVQADRWWSHYFELLALAAALWLVSALAWGAFLLTLLARRPEALKVNR